VRKLLYFFGLIGGTLAALFLARLGGVYFNAQQITSVAIFSMFIYGTLLFGDFRLAFAFGGIALLMGLNLLTVEGFAEAANLKVIIFLVGMFLVIGYLEENQFFEHIVGEIVARVGPRPKLLLAVMMLMGTVSAALVDEVTSILFMSGAMLSLTSKYKLNPVPFIIMLVFATNIGSAASSIGNPIGVMIALNAGFSFLEFLRWSAPIAVVVNVVTMLICRWWFADSVKAFEEAVEREHQAVVARRTAAGRRVLVGTGGGGGEVVEGGGEYKQDFAPGLGGGGNHSAPLDADAVRARRISWVVFACTILLLVTHGLTERLLGILMHAPGGRLGEGTMMIGASLIMGCVVLMLRGSKARELVERRVDWWTLTFFMMLFASVGTLKQTQVTGVIAEHLIKFAGPDHPGLLIQIVGWATGWLSAFLDNVLAVATFMPVVEDVRNHVRPNGYPEAIYWLMLFGGTFMGNMTVIGSTANIIAVGVLEKRGFGTVSFGYWFKIGFLVSIASMLVATVLLGLQTGWFRHPLLGPPK
jgi:Na+/H+ antiporter NhaD/arsenite permease-like protein